MAELGVRLFVLNSNDEAPANIFNQMDLKVEKIDHQINRNPVIVSIPEINRNKTAGGMAGQPATYAIDFGLLQETITLSGVSKDGVVGITNPSHHQLAEVARTSWRFVEPNANDSEMGIKGGVRVRIEEGEGHNVRSYRGVVLNFRASKTSGNLWWDWSMTIQVTNYPIGDL